MEKIECKACSAIVDKSLEFCSSCGEWLGLSIEDFQSQSNENQEPQVKRTRIPQLKCSNCLTMNMPSQKNCKECGQLLIKPLSSYGATSMPNRKEVPGIRAVLLLAVIIPIIAISSYYYNQNIAEEVVEEIQIIQQSTTTSSTTTIQNLLKKRIPISCTASSSLDMGFTCENLYDGSPLSWQDKSLKCEEATLEFTFSQDYFIEFITFDNLIDSKSFTRNFKARDILITSDEEDFSVEKELENLNNASQWIDLNTTTSTLTINILSTYPGEELNGTPAFQECAIQEIQFYGRG